MSREKTCIKCFPRKEGEKWICMHCDEIVPDPNSPVINKEIFTKMDSICSSCIHIDFLEDIKRYKCNKVDTIVTGVILNCPQYEKKK